MNRPTLGFVGLLLAIQSATGAAEEPKVAAAAYPSIGKIERLDPKLGKLIPADAKIEKLAGGFEWAEGPVWLPAEQSLLFSDIPNNRIMQWREGSRDAGVYLKPSGYLGTAPFTGHEPGSNGLTLDHDGRLVACQHGERRVVRFEKNWKQTVLADKFEGKRFNSPNDLCYSRNGDLYFTDPPYGLPKNWDDPARELDWSGVYRLSKEGKLTLLIKDLTRPNGIAFSPDEKTLYIAVSDPAKAVWMAYPVNADGTLGTGRVLFDATAWVKAGKKGLPDGMKVDRDGNLFAAGPGGVSVFSPGGQHLGTIDAGETTANCNWGDDGSTLYMTADKIICRIKTSTKGNGWQVSGQEKQER